MSTSSMFRNYQESLLKSHSRKLTHEVGKRVLYQVKRQRGNHVITILCGYVEAKLLFWKHFQEKFMAVLDC